MAEEQQMRIMGLDLGSKTVGVAISDLPTSYLRSRTRKFGRKPLHDSRRMPYLCTVVITLSAIM